MTEKCHICTDSITINMLYSNAFRYIYESRSYSFHHICLEDLANTKNENKSLKMELKCMKEKELMIFKQEIGLVTKQQSERIQTLKNELKTYKGDFFCYFLNKFYSCFEDFFVILESKENEIKELQNKLETITKEHESCQKEAESNKDQLKSIELEPAASESLLEQENDDSSEIIEESSLPEEITDKRITRFRSKRNIFKHQMKYIQVNRFKIFLHLRYLKKIKLRFKCFYKRIR
jgi:hypothetical protein